LVPLRPLLIADPLEDAFVDQPSKTLGEHLSWDAQTALELLEATQAQQCVAHDQQCPALPDDLEGACDRAVLAFVGALEHGLTIPSQFRQGTENLLLPVPSRNESGRRGETVSQHCI